MINKITQMTNRIKQFILAMVFVVIPVWIVITPNQTLAESDREFWKMPFVKDIKTIWTEKKQNDSLIHTIQTAIIWVLWLLSMISLCLVIYAWFLMLTSWWDSKKYDKGLSIIKNAAIGLAIIAVSWLIVSLIFYVINGSTKPNV
jgi:hypothetical protein